MKFILLIEMPASVSMSRRNIISSKLEKQCYEKPKRNVYLFEWEEELMMKKIESWIKEVTENEKIKVKYYRLAE